MRIRWPQAIHIAQRAGRLVHQRIFARMAYDVQKPPCIWVSSNKKGAWEASMCSTHANFLKCQAETGNDAIQKSVRLGFDIFCARLPWT